MTNFNPPYLGVAYYPEAWPESEIGKDLDQMRQSGINLVRISEFAWSKMEPFEGQYEFGWLHSVLKILEKKEMAVVLCTPTATPPAWLTQKYPEVLRVTAEGLAMTHGGRKHYCPNSQTYRHFARQIAGKLAGEFSLYKNLVGWQIDNEFSGDCYCKGCEGAFQLWLKKRYGSVEHLNQEWNTVLWSQTYNSFEQVPLPNLKRARHNPSLVYNYKQFMSESHTGFAQNQAEAIRSEDAHHPITTNGMPTSYKIHRIDYSKMFKKLDFVCLDVYEDPQRLWRLCFEFDWMRSLKQVPYWVMETSSTGTGALFPRLLFLHDPGALRAKIWLSFALGGEAVLFWLWRMHWAGQEMEHGALLYPWGETTPAVKEIQTVSAELKEYEDIIKETMPVRPRVAIHHSYESAWVFDFGPIAENLDYDRELDQFYRIFLDSNIGRDVIFPEAEVQGYEVVFSPFMPVISNELLRKMEQFVTEGGTWVVGPLSACRTAEGTAHPSAAYGELEQFAKLHVRHRFPANPKGTFAQAGGKKFRCLHWCDAFESTPAQTIARYTNGPAKGLAAIAESRIGKGRVIFLGTLPDPKFLGGWINRSWGAVGAGLAPAPSLMRRGFKPARPGVVVVPRANRSGKMVALIAVELSGKPGTFTIGRQRFTLPPYGVKIIRLPD